ncbi:membrane protein [Neptunitalea sp. Y10]|uniref:Membrane protein n=2 Tax=Neptunitalea lumnitzerae TaxID=2965509 RepID=A0ABQ5MI21_9FLAO|nr:membrane protein [Neptunitalea sp. Y10]
MNRIYITLVLIILAQIALSQTNNLTGSPYSLYGLGVFNEANLGKTNALGKSGVALESFYEINNLNPASLATMTNKSFMFDVGFTGEMDTYQNNKSEDSKWRTNFSNLAIAFPVSNKAAMSIVLTPFTNVGYELVGLETNVEGSSDLYTTYVTGSGGLNSFKANYGMALTDKINIGAGLEYIFGNIEETEVVDYDSNYLYIDRDTYYKNLRATVGFQYQPSEKFGFGATVKFPTSLHASQDIEVSKVIDLVEVTVQDEEELDINNFDLPLEFAVGFKKTFWNKLTVNADYRRSFWDATDQEDNLGSFKDQDFIGAGFEYLGNVRSFKYWDRVRYRAGLTYDNGYLSINQETINNKALTLGLGLPLSLKNNSFINVSYSYGERGVVSSTLTKENYHLLSINLSLENIWFVKSKIN